MIDDYVPAGMAVCEYCLAVVPFEFAIHWETGELVRCYPGDWGHNAGCPFDEPIPEECPF